MPYIPQAARNEFYPMLTDISYQAVTHGDLNYIITTICDTFLLENGESYENFNSIIGVLECAKLEYYRRRVAPYEDKAIAKNGDIY